MTVSEYAARWLARIAPQVASQTHRAYALYLRRHVLPALGAREVASLRPPDIATLGDTLVAAAYAPATVRAIGAVLRRLLDAAVAEELLVSNPIPRVWRGFAGRRTHRSAIPAEDFVVLDALLTARVAAGEPLAALMCVALEAGLRLGEALALEWAAVDWAGRRVQVRQTWHDHYAGPPKGRRPRWVDLTDVALTALRQQVGRDARWCFPSPRTGLPYCRRHPQEVFPRWCLAATGRRYTLHQLRHSYAVQLAEAGAPLAWLQAQLGHSSIAITRDLYAREARLPRPRILDRWAARRHGPVRALGSRTDRWQENQMARLRSTSA